MASSARPCLGDGVGKKERGQEGRGADPHAQEVKRLLPMHRQVHHGLSEQPHVPTTDELVFEMQLDKSDSRVFGLDGAVHDDVCESFEVEHFSQAFQNAHLTAPRCGASRRGVVLLSRVQETGGANPSVPASSSSLDHPFSPGSSPRESGGESEKRA